MAAQDLIGQRIKAIRRQRGLSQAQLAHPELSDSYVSLIESGKRTPTPAVLELLAKKLDCSLSYLVNGVTAEQLQELELALNFARLALDNGDVAEARRRYGELLADGNLAGLTALRQEARYGYALALEACGELDQAVDVLNELRESEGATLPPERKIAVTLALCRVHRERGEFSSAVEVGEQMLEGPDRGPWTDDLVELGATLLIAYLVRGDLLRAEQFAAELLAAAEALGTPRAIVASCWNAAVLAEQAGRGEEALALIERALAVQSETGDQRNLARLRQAYAALTLRVRPDQAETARDILLRAQREHEETATSKVDKARCSVVLAHAELELGNPEQALEHARAAVRHLEGMRREPLPSARLLLGQTHFLLNDAAAAKAELDVLGSWLEDAPRCRRTAETWRAVAELHERMGDREESVAAYRRALACVDL